MHGRTTTTKHPSKTFQSVPSIHQRRDDSGKTSAKMVMAKHPSQKHTNYPLEKMERHTWSRCAHEESTEVDDDLKPTGNAPAATSPKTRKRRMAAFDMKM